MPSTLNATTAREFQGGTPNWRTDLYSTGGTLLSHKESIQLIKSLGAKFTPELKGPNRSAKLQVEAVFGSQAGYAQAMINDYKAAGIAPKDVFAQSFSLADILYWIQHEPKFGKQAVFLDDANVPSELPTLAELKALAAQGVKIVAPPMWALLTVDGHGKIVPSQYARNAKAANLDIITWTLERSGRIVEEVLPTKGTASPSFYYQTTLDALAQRWRHPGHARRAGQAGRHSRHLLRLGGDGDVLRQLHGPEVAAAAAQPSRVRALRPTARPGFHAHQRPSRAVGPATRAGGTARAAGASLPPKSGLVGPR